MSDFPQSLGSLIISEIYKYESEIGKKPGALILSISLKEKLQAELVNMGNGNLIADSELNSFFGLHVTTVQIVYGGYFRWALGS